MSAVLHHMTDDEARRLFAALRMAVKPGGRIVTIDCAYAVRQNPFARLLISLDRGRHIRFPDAYVALAAPYFSAVTGETVHQAWPPYTFWIMTARGPFRLEKADRT